jgi:hypothetical protein
MNMNYYKKWLVAILVTALCLSSFTSSTAQVTTSTWAAIDQSVPHNDPSLDACVTANRLQIQVANAAVTMLYRERLLQSNEFLSFSADLQRTHGNLAIQRSAIQVVQISKLNRVGAIVPISGGAGQSWFAEWYDQQSDEMIASVAGLFSLTDNHNISARIDVNGQTIVQAVIAANGQLLEGAVLLSGKDEPIETITGESLETTNRFSCLLNCLGGCGVPPWLSTLLNAVCRVTCTVIGISCWWCLLVQIGPWLGCLTYCWGQCAPKTLYLPLVLR